jgi:hypothetical protein
MRALRIFSPLIPRSIDCHSERSEEPASRLRLAPNIALISSQRTLCPTSVPSVLNLSFSWFSLKTRHLKIKMIMVATSRIKPRPAPRTPRLALQILPNRHLHPASPAQNRPRIPLPPRPNSNRMPRQRIMAILASIVDPATPHLDRNNVHRRVVMHAPRQRIDIDSANLWALFMEDHRLLFLTLVKALDPWSGKRPLGSRNASSRRLIARAEYSDSVCF